MRLVNLQQLSSHVSLSSLVLSFSDNNRETFLSCFLRKLKRVSLNLGSGYIDSALNPPRIVHQLRLTLFPEEPTRRFRANGPVKVKFHGRRQLFQGELVALNLKKGTKARNKKKER